MIKYLNKTTEKIYFGFIAFKPIAKQSPMLKGMVEELHMAGDMWKIRIKSKIYPSQSHNFWKTLPSK